ncbi:CG42814, partial [Drosophila busckii]
ITRVWFSALPKDSPWIKPCRLHYVENGKQKCRDMIKILDSVMVLLYNASREKLIFVRQFRPAVYQSLIMANMDLPKGDIDLIKFPPQLGITIEPCAGMVDKDKSLAEIAREEVLEECGYDVPADRLELIYKYRTTVGSSSSTLTLFYCEVCDAERVSAGGGIDNEVIEIVELTIAEAKELAKTGATINSGPGTPLCILWFLAHKS